MINNERSIINKLEGLLDEARFKHSLRVQELAVDLSKHHKVDPNKASLAGILHDCARYLPPKALLIKAEEVGLHIEPIMRFEPKLLHAPLSGYFARTDYNIDDTEIINAIERHTIGSAEMTPLDKVIYIADHVEPEREYPGVAKARGLMKKNIDAAICAIASSMIKYLLDIEKPVHPQTLETRNSHLRKANKLW